MTMKQQQVVVCAVLVLLAMAGVASAASCNVGQLTPCASPLATGATPSASCCSSLRAQQGCFCTYAKNPTYARYINSPNAKKVVASCGLTVPRC
ncbi:non-specific lipid-transfer protein 2P [Setaria viridis]|uniref:Bifunctional inhibitor/plant lipid transfer protein/seed storage helical domain-containing protein n=1 Tax=Setaria viridis TaxID=4556 RepID=A0A4V6D2I1_SETVI|nr:non-specific lipid-transfer protein 2P-like [Setaria viridis]TKV98655.1 hypothetical protein SEVIR_9G574100v2 [Setaria viridis]